MLIFFGVFLVFVGFLFTLTIIGSIIGIPTMLLGIVLIVAGVFARRKTVITNVVHVQNAPASEVPSSQKPMVVESKNTH